MRNLCEGLFCALVVAVVAYLILEVFLTEHGQDGVTSDFILGRCNNTTLITALQFSFEGVMPRCAGTIGTAPRRFNTAVICSLSPADWIKSSILPTTDF